MGVFHIEYMTILFVIYGSIHQVSGGYEYDRHVINYLIERGHRVVVYSLNDTGYWSNFSNNLRNDLRRCIDRIGPDIVMQDHLIHPSVVLANRALQGTFDIPLVALVHHLRCSESHPEPLRSIYGAVERCYFSTVDACIYNSATTRRSVETLIGGTPPSTVAYPGRWDAVRVEHRQKKSTDTAVHLLFVGNVIPRKGLDVLLRALDSLQRSDWLLTIVGDTLADAKYFEYLQWLVQTAGLDQRASFEGRVSEKQLHATYADHEVLVVPSRYEGFGIVYLEAMAYGTPVIASTAGAAREFITDGEVGFLVTPDDVDELARRLQTMIENPALRHQMGQQARETWEAHPTWMETGQTVETFLETLIHSEPEISPLIRE